MGERLEALARIVMLPLAYVLAIVVGAIMGVLTLVIFIVDILLQLVTGKEGFTADNPAVTFRNYYIRVIDYVAFGEGRARDTAPKWARK